VLALVPVVIAAVTSCSTPIAKTAAAVELTIKGEQVLLRQELQAQAEAELSYTLNFGYVARTGSSPVGCWFARTDLASEVDSRLWCGPVQVPGTAPASDWVPVPERGRSGIPRRAPRRRQAHQLRTRALRGTRGQPARRPAVGPRDGLGQPAELALGRR
jgi:hypothetical protein